MVLTNKIVKEAYDKVRGHGGKLHRLLCEMSGKHPTEINLRSLQVTVKRMVLLLRRLKHARNNVRYHQFSEREFIFPTLRTPNEPSSLTTNCTSCFVKDRTINHLNYQILQMRTKIVQHNTSAINQKIKRQRDLIEKLKSKVENLQCQNNLLKEPAAVDKQDRAIQCNTMKSIVTDLKTEIDEMRDRIDELMDENKENMETTCDKSLLSFRTNDKGRPYIEALRKLYYTFLSRKIGLQHIKPLAERVLLLVGMQIDELPGTTTTNKTISELGTVSREHLSEELIKSEVLTMHRDATTKKGRHFYGVEFSHENGQTYTAGLREVSNGKAETYVNCTNEILKDITNSSDILDKTKSYMTDRSSTETKTNRLLNEGKSQDECSYEFKCGMHALLQFNDVCTKTVSAFEDETFTKSEQERTSMLLSFISKLFYKDGSGDPLYVPTYLKEKGINLIPIMNNRGSRFNTLFYNAAGTFYLSSHLIEYFQNYKPENLNYTMNYINKSLKSKVILSICRALGIICKIITEPYLNKASDETLSALDMGSIYNRLIDVLHTGIEQPELFLKNQISLTFGTFQSLSAVSESLFLSSDLDEQTKGLISKLCSCLQEKSKSLFKDFLEGGIYYQPTSTMLKDTKTCPPSNITVERLMAKLDSQLKSAPTSNISSIENRIMYRNNKTSDWLNEKSKDEQESIILNARQQNSTVIKNNQDQKRKLHKEHVATLQERETAKKVKLKKIETKKNNVLEELKTIGIWETEEKIRNELEKLKTKSSKVQALKKQINMIKEFVNVKEVDKQLLQYSHKGKQHHEETLIKNILHLLKIKQSQSADLPDEIKEQLTTNPKSFIGRHIRHTWEDADKVIQWMGRFMRYDGGFFEIKYWGDDGTEETGNDYWLAVEEIKADYGEKTFHFTSLSDQGQSVQ